MKVSASVFPCWGEGHNHNWRVKLIIALLMFLYHIVTVSSLPAWYSHPASPSVNIITCRNTGTGSGSYTIDHKV